MPISPSPVPPRGQRRHLLSSLRLSGPVVRSPVLRGPAAALGLLLCLALGSGCAKQAEGERCDQNNGDLDCETGLVCKGEANLSIKGRGFALCCPATGESTVDACRGVPDLPMDMPDIPTPVPEAGALPETPAPVTEDAGTLQPDATPAP